MLRREPSARRTGTSATPELAGGASGTSTPGRFEYRAAYARRPPQGYEGDKSDRRSADEETLAGAQVDRARSSPRAGGARGRPGPRHVRDRRRRQLHRFDSRYRGVLLDTTPSATSATWPPPWWAPAGPRSLASTS